MTDSLTWEPCRVRLGDLKEWEHNPATIGKAEAERLLESLDEFGQVQALAIDPDNVIVDGHQRKAVWSMAERYGLDWVADCRRASRILTEKERQKLAVFLRSGAVGKYDWDELANWGNPEELIQWGMDKSLADSWQAGARWIDDMIDSTKPEADAEPQLDRAAEFLEKWQVKPGDLWRIGEHKLLCGDSTKREDVERLIQGERVRMEFSDPPYEFETAGGGIRENAAHMDAIDKHGINHFDPSTIELIALTSVFCCNKDLIPSYLEIAKKNKQAWDLCFYKKENTPPNFGGHLMTDTEYLPVIGKQAPISGMEKAIYSKAYIGGLDEGHIVAWQKPTGLIDKFLRLFSVQNDIVLDRFCGTGSTLVACQNLGRRGRGIEISPAYCAVTLERMSQAFPGIDIQRINNDG